MATTDTKLNQLVINDLTQEQYDAALAAGQINNDELWLTPDTSIMSLAADGTTITYTKGDGTSEDVQITFNDGTPGLEYTEYDSYVECIGLGTATDTDIRIASIYNGKRVTSIGDLAFSECFSLTNIVIPNSVTSIGSYAFGRCESLASMVIPDSVTSIGDHAFYECLGLTNVVISNSVTSIGIGAFELCDSLTSITIPFVGATKDGTDNTHFGYIFGATAYTDNSSYVPSLLKEVIIIGGDINESAFYTCSNLTSVVIGDSVTSIGDEAFGMCSSLTSVVIGDGVTSIGAYAFYNCSSLTSVVIPDSVTSIGGYAFNKCSSITSVVIGDSVTSIGRDAFNNCTTLTSVTIPDSITSIGSSAFANCSSLTSVYYNGTVAQCSGTTGYSNISTYATIYCVDGTIQKAGAASTYVLDISLTSTITITGAVSTSTGSYNQTYGNSYTPATQSCLKLSDYYIVSFDTNSITTDYWHRFYFAGKTPKAINVTAKKNTTTNYTPGAIAYISGNYAYVGCDENGSRPFYVTVICK